MRENRTRQKGITLIALVITIIVLLILAGVSIATLTGQNGVLTQAQNAKEQTNKEGAREKLSLILADLQSQKIPKGESLVLGDALAGEIASYDEVTSANFTGSIIEVVIDGYNFEVNGDLGIENGLEKVEPENIKDWEYIVDEETGSAVITCYKGTDTTVVIPNYIDGYWVKKIDPYNTGLKMKLWDDSICEVIENYDSFGTYPQRTITEIVISNGIEEIGARAFVLTEKLEKVTLPRSITKIGQYAFALEHSGRRMNKGKKENFLKTLNIYKNVQIMDSEIINGREDITINVEYNENEIPEEVLNEYNQIVDGWSKNWNRNKYQYFFNSFIEFKTTINYGVAMD